MQNALDDHPSCGQPLTNFNGIEIARDVENAFKSIPIVGGGAIQILP
jgi:hypothetical protein